MARVAREGDRARNGADGEGERPARGGSAVRRPRTRADGADERPASSGSADRRRAPRRGRTSASAEPAREAPPERGDGAPARRIRAPQAARAGLRQIVELTGKEPEGVTSVQPTEGGWVVGVEVVEDRRIPSSSDILSVYEADLDANGDLMSYRRSRRYSRGRGNDEA